MIFKSENMMMYELKIAIESGWYFMEEIGQTGLLEIVPQEYEKYKKNIYAEQVEVCKDLSAKLDSIENLCTIFNVSVKRAPKDIDELHELYSQLLDKKDEFEPSRHTIISSLSELVGQKEKVIKEIYNNYLQLKFKNELLIEQYHLIRVLSLTLPTSDIILRNADEENPETQLETFGFYYMCGTIKADDAFRLQRYLFRISRENIVFQLFDLSYEGNKVQPEIIPPLKKVYFIVFQTGATTTLKQKIKDVLRTFNANPGKLPVYYSKVSDSLADLENQFLSSTDLIASTAESLKISLGVFTEIKDGKISFIEQCKFRIGKELKIFEELNKFKVDDKIMSSWIWVVEENMELLKKRITQITKNNPNIKAYISEVSYKDLKIIPPTHFKLSDITRPFQEIVDTYGIPRFQEVNPAYFTMITFPYMFGIMFGDIGHGGLLLLVGWLMIKYSEVWRQKGITLVDYRFLFFGMGFFSFFCGLIYNDFLSIPWKLFPSCYSRTHKRFEKSDPECTYLLGFDSVWPQSKQEISFINSFKMKLSIIVGVIHMVVGILMKGLNSLNFGNWVDFIFEFLPQLIFMLSTFGYMCAAIILKWLQDWGDGSQAPSIIAIFINAGYSPPGSVLYGDSQGLQQTQFQQRLFQIAFICMFVMLLPKPIIMWIKTARSHGPSHRKSQNLVEIIEHSNDLAHKLLDNGPQSPKIEAEDLNKMKNPHAVIEEEHDISEIFIHQMIETIEFVLGSISNTASYLRLWALSLAHGQLARVFLDMTVLNQLKAGSPIAAVMGFPFFVGCTVGVLMFMDLMECFLHTLRLHWVEFQNKFYKGDGYKYVKFDIVCFIKEHLEQNKS